MHGTALIKIQKNYDPITSSHSQNINYCREHTVDYMVHGIELAVCKLRAFVLDLNIYSL